MVGTVLFYTFLGVALLESTAGGVGAQVVNQNRSAPGLASAYEGSPAQVELYKRVGTSHRLIRFAIVEVDGSIWFTSKGIKSGVGSLRRLQLDSSDDDKWLSITKQRLVNGRAVITTEDGKTYTIFNLGLGPFAGEIALGATSTAAKPTQK